MSHSGIAFCSRGKVLSRRKKYMKDFRKIS
ncbi:hypothetical protein [Sulfurospirillum sp. hDNRA2]